MREYRKPARYPSPAAKVDPNTAVTCVNYIRAVVVQLAGRAFPAPTRRFPDREGLEVFAARREFAEYLVGFVEVGRYANGDAHVAAALLKALEAVARVAREAGAYDRAGETAAIAGAIGGQAAAEAKTELDRRTIERLLGGVRHAAGTHP